MELSKSSKIVIFVHYLPLFYPTPLLTYNLDHVINELEETWVYIIYICKISEFSKLFTTELSLMTIHSRRLHGQQLCFPSGFCPHFSLNNSSPAADHLNRVLTSSLGLEGSSGHPLVDQKLTQFMSRHLSKNCWQESLSTRLPLTGALVSLLGVGFPLGHKDHQFFHPTIFCLFVC